VTTDIDVNIEPLPGYRLIKHLGAGGYGEVWSAEAPGGLTKAIKFVFGQHDEKRASHELRALDRVRGVRHPFLLSLERIEIVNGRLLVVTELADCSLKDRFDQCRKQGLPGIPREELIRYLRDAADALDFMNTAHALGHLDIKPENLLLLADHVKVADFGLVKDVRQSQASLVGGMTPLYAAPEVFRGLPGPQSDEYSLAVVYQEMLTGGLPFSGGNAAQLTLQHLNDEPELSSLPASDRYAVSRALSKDPAHRFPTCREFVDALASANAESRLPNDATENSSFDTRPSPMPLPTSPSCPTDVFDVDETDVHALDPTRMLIELPVRQASLVDLQPLSLEGQTCQSVPTLVLGIGGAAARVLSHLKSMLHDRFGGGAPVPAIQILLVDTDSRTIADVTSRDGSPLAPDETVHLPLQRPQHYREQSQQLLRWLSRRWLYNIPRSLRTEGLRPLGRLALTDHARQAGQRIRRGIIQAIDADSVARSSRAVGLPFRGDAVQVFVVASISGGTGSGMSLDVGYAVRAVLDRLHLSQTKITGLMLHATGGDARHCELSRVNSYSWLTEFQHFQQPGAAYPGDTSCGFPAHEGGVKPFDDTYLVHLGDHLDDDDFDTATRNVAEYLRLNIAEPARAFFDACRREQGAGSGEPGANDEARMMNDETGHSSFGIRQSSFPQLRSFGIFRQTATASGSCDDFAHLVGKQVIENWLAPAGPGSAASASSEAPAAQLVRRLRLNADEILANSQALFALNLGADADTFFASWMAQETAGQSGNSSPLALVDRIFGDSAGESDDNTGELLGQSMGAIVGPLEEKLRAELRRWVMSRLDDPHERLAGARTAIAWLSQHLQNADRELRTKAGTKPAAGRNDGGSGMQAPSTASAFDYFRGRLDHLAARTAARTARLLLSDVKTLADELTALGREIEQMARGIDVVHAASSRVSETEAKRQDAACTWLRPRLATLAEEVEKQLAAECLQDQGLWTTIMQGGRRRAQLSAMLNEFSRQVVLRSLGGVNVMQEWSADSGPEAAPVLRSKLAAATPALLALGGTRRVLAIVPRDGGAETSAAELSRMLGVGVNVVAGNDNSATLCVEAAGLPLVDVAVELVQRRRDRVEFAGRVQSRTDIAWTRLLPEAADSTPNPWAELGQSPEFQEQVLAKTMVI
jgi:serine/threonine protein kinase